MYKKVMILCIALQACATRNKSLLLSQSLNLPLAGVEPAIFSLGHWCLNLLATRVVKTSAVWLFHIKTPSKQNFPSQMSGPKISWYGKSILGRELWPGLVSGKKWSGPILSNFFGCFFQFFMGKKIFFLNFFYIVASALKSCIK